MDDGEDTNAESGPVLAPGEKNALGDLLNDPERYRSPDVLTVVPLLSELALALDGVTAGRQRLFEADRKSLVADADVALTRVGNELNGMTTPTLRDLRTKEVARLRRVFNDPAAAGELATKVRGVLDQLREPTAVGAAWDDVLAAIANGSATASTCALRVAQLAELVGARGYDWSSMKQNLTSAVVNDELAAGRSSAMADSPGEVTVAWVAFGNAHLDGGYLRLGQVQFFGDQLKLEEIRDGAPALSQPEFEPAPELTPEAIEWH